MYSGKKPFRLGVQIPSQDGTSFYRGTGPIFRLMKSLGHELTLEMSSTNTWAYFSGVDAIFMQRPCTADHVRVIKMAKANGCPVWVDYDDDLFSVPMQNPTFMMYSRKDIQRNVVDCLLQADVVSVSTPHLLKRYLDTVEAVYRKTDTTIAPDEDRQRLRPEKFVCVPNAYDEKLFNFSFREWKKPAPDPLPLLVWRGSATHDADLSSYSVAMGNAFTRYGLDWTMNFIGSPWWGTLDHLKRQGIESDRIQVTPPLDVTEYMHFITAVRPAVMQVPLMDDIFNRSKSNIAWIEATHAGALTLAPDWDEWHRPGVITYKNSDDYFNKLGLLLRGHMPRHDLLQASRGYIAENLTLSRVNRIREQIIETLCAVDPWA